MFWFFEPSTFVDDITPEQKTAEQDAPPYFNFIGFYIAGLLAVIVLFFVVTRFFGSSHIGLDFLLDVFPISVVGWISNQFQSVNILIYSTIVYGSLFAVFYIRNEMDAVTKPILNYGVGKSEVERLIELRSENETNTKTKKKLARAIGEIASSSDTKKFYYIFCIFIPIATLFHVLTDNVPWLLFLYCILAITIFFFLKDMYRIIPSKNLELYLQKLDAEYSRILLVDNELDGDVVSTEKTLSEHQSYIEAQKYDKELSNVITKYLDKIKSQEGAKNEWFNHEHLKNEFRNGYLSIARDLRKKEIKNFENIVEVEGKFSFNKKQELREIIKIAKELRKNEGVINKSVLLNKIDNVKTRLQILGTKYVNRKSTQ